jgi:hypothetical protein
LIAGTPAPTQGDAVRASSDFRFRLKTSTIVIPAEAGIHALLTRVVWIPAFAGMMRFMSFRSGNGMRYLDDESKKIAAGAR